MGWPDISTAGHSPQQTLKDPSNLPGLSYKKNFKSYLSRIAGPRLAVPVLHPLKNSVKDKSQYTDGNDDSHKFVIFHSIPGIVN